jgi:hypothetical protein
MYIKKNIPKDADRQIDRLAVQIMENKSIRHTKKESPKDANRQIDRLIV